MRTRRITTALAAIAGLVLLATCAAANRQPAGDAEPVAAPARVTVVNRGFYDAVVYATRDGVTVAKVGVVEGNSSVTFVLFKALLGSQVAFYARTIGEGREFRSGPTQIYPTAWLVWQLGPQPGSEFLYEKRSEAGQ